MKNIAILIPCLNPTDYLIHLVGELMQNNFYNIIVVNDGSDSLDIFNKLNNKVYVLNHDKNYGKGKAIKTGIKYIKNNFNVDGIITVDCDGQHLVKDIIKVSEKIDKNLVLGCRNFNKKTTPFKSYYGNKITSLYFRIITGKKCTDTQTGLRGIPKNLFDYSLSIPGDRFEYEMNYLVDYTKKYSFTTVPIQTVYENKNKGSTFKTIRDSYLIYKKSIKNLVVAFLSFVIDILLFSFLNFITKELIFSIIISSITARLLSGTYNMLLTKFLNCNKENLRLFLLKLILSTTFVYIMGNILTNIILIKIIVDILLSVAIYFIKIKVYNDNTKENM